MLAGICRVNDSNSFQFVLLFEATSVNPSAGTVQLPAHFEPVNWPQNHCACRFVSLQAISRIWTQKLRDL